MRKADWVVREVVALDRRLNGAGRFGTSRRCGCRVIAAHFNRLHAHEGVRVGKSFVAKVLQRERLAQLRALRERKHRMPPALPVNAVWGLDATCLNNGHEQHAVLGIVDHGCRVLMALRRVRRLNAWSALGILCLAIGEWGRPVRVRTDNAALFHSRVWRHGLRLLGMRRQFTQPGCPWQNGRIERLFGTFKQCWAACPGMLKTAMDIRLAEFSRWYNAARPHQHLGGLAPLEAWQGARPLVEQIVHDRWEYMQLWGGALRGFVPRE